MYDQAGYQSPSGAKRKIIGAIVALFLVLGVGSTGYFLMGSGDVVSPLPKDTVRIIFATPEPLFGDVGEASVAGEMVEESLEATAKPKPTVKPSQSPEE